MAENIESMAVRPVLAGAWVGADGIDALSAALWDRDVERLLTDAWTPGHGADDREDLVLGVEPVASRRDPYRRLTRLSHLLGRRPVRHGA